MEEPKLYTKYLDGKPYQYRYGEPWRATQLMVDGGYDTPEEAKAAWEAEQDYSKVICRNCGERRNYHIWRRRVKLMLRGVEIGYIHHEAHCAACLKEVYVPTVNDINVTARERAYEEARRSENGRVPHTDRKNRSEKG